MNGEAGSELALAGANRDTMSQIEQIPVMPFNDMTMADLLRMVTAMLNEIVGINDKIKFNPNKLTRFHSRVPPDISIKDYLLRIVRFCSLDPAILVVLVYFIDLLSRSYDNFVVNSLTVHRFLITAVTIASKGLCDSFCTNAHYAKVGGLQQMELNLLEVEFLTRIAYRIVPEARLFEEYYISMFLRHGTNILRSKKSIDSLGTLAERKAGSANPPPPPPQQQATHTPREHTPMSPHESSGDESKSKFTRAVKNMFHPMRKRGSDAAILAEYKRPKQ